jgi:hypothetical protein
MVARVFSRSFTTFALSLWLLVVASEPVAAEAAAVGQQQVGEADVVYKNGFVYTVDAVRTRAQAFALRDGKCGPSS